MLLPIRKITVEEKKAALKKMKPDEATKKAAAKNRDHVFEFMRRLRILH